MLENQQAKCSIAWFTLAQLILKKEKEKALALHKLLSYSLKNEALSWQLKGDILTAFECPDALEAYQRAILEYEKLGHTLEAAYLCENIALQFSKIEYALCALQKYNQLNIIDKINILTKLILNYYKDIDNENEGKLKIKEILASQSNH